MEYAVFERLETPIWIYDLQALRMVWANASALNLWNLPTLADLLSQDFSDLSEAIRIRLQHYLDCFERGETVQETWTVAPQGRALSFQCACSGFPLTDGRTAMLVEARSPLRRSPSEADTLRSVAVLDCTPCLISLFALDGTVLFQNSAAIACYGSDFDFTARFCEDSLAQAALQAVHSGQSWQIDCEVLTQRGVCWHHLELRTTPDPVTGNLALLLSETEISDLRRAELEHQHVVATLQESSNRYHTVLEALTEGIVMHGVDGQIVTCNRSAQAILGLTFDQIVGCTPTDPQWRTIHEDGSPFPGEEHPAAVTLRTGQPQRHVVMGIQKPDNRLTWISINTQPLQASSTASPYAVVASFADITAKKMAEDALRESEARWHFALEGAGEGLWDWNNRTNTVFFSTQWKAMLGYREDEIGNALDEWDSRIHPDDRERCYADLHRHFRGETPIYVNEHRVRCKDGSYKWILDRGKVIEWADTGEPLRMIGTHTDITDRHRMETARRQQSEMLQAIVNHIPIMLAMFDASGQVQFINQAMEASLGWTFADWQARNRMADCYPNPADLQHVITHIQAANGQWQDYKTRTATGQVIDTAWANIRLSDGRLIGIGQDITHRKRIEEALQQSAHRDRLLMQVSRRIAQALDLQSVLDTAVSEVRQQLQVHQVCVCRFEPDQDNVTLMAAAIAEEWQCLQPIAVGCHHTMARSTVMAFTQRQPIQNVADIYTADITASQVDLLAQSHIRAYLVIPILHGQSLWGLLSCYHADSPRPWQPAEVDMLGQLADHIAIAIQQAELYQQLQQANRELQHLATHDKLTGLANRRYFDQYLHQEWRRLAREQAPLGIILCDIDHFKRYNDAFGHIAGDDCLVQVAEAISRAVQRPGDLVARYGGEEFTVVLPNTDLTGAIQIAEKIRRAIELTSIPHAASPVDSQITLSLGIACVYPSLSLVPEQLVAMADGALYQAKQLGRDRYCVAQ